MRAQQSLAQSLVARQKQSRRPGAGKWNFHHLKHPGDILILLAVVALLAVVDIVVFGLVLTRFQRSRMYLD